MQSSGLHKELPQYSLVAMIVLVQTSLLPAPDPQAQQSGYLPDNQGGSESTQAVPSWQHRLGCASGHALHKLWHAHESQYATRRLPAAGELREVRQCSAPAPTGRNPEHRRGLHRPSGSDSGATAGTELLTSSSVAMFMSATSLSWSSAMPLA